MVSDAAPRLEPTNADGHERAAAACRDGGNVGLPFVPGSPEGNTLAHKEEEVSRTALASSYFMSLGYIKVLTTSPFREPPPSSHIE